MKLIIITAAIIQSSEPIVNSKAVLKPADICTHSTSTSVSSLASFKRWNLRNPTWSLIEILVFPWWRIRRVFWCPLVHCKPYRPRFHPNIIRELWQGQCFYIWTTISCCRSHGLRMHQKQPGFSFPQVTYPSTPCFLDSFDLSATRY